MKYSKEWLRKELTENKKMEYLFFWGHQPSKDGSIIKTCMSQWWPINFSEDNIVYRTAEHYMMAGKAKLFGDMEIFEKIISSNSPKDVKALGRLVKNFDPVTWDAHKYQIVNQGNILKFSQNADLKKFLLQTGSKVIVEASPRDLIWGIGMGEANPKSQHPDTWRGRNLLGFALMEVRDELLKN
jgi:ribA/ribD-fused uncharacterized protein